MESMFILIPISIILAVIIGYFFWWSGKSGQFDDLEGPAHRILMDDDSTEHLHAGKNGNKEKNEDETVR
ncbi:cbb3-type cytochrome oxidase assembly protein CcoS [Neisseria sp.]|uniref:cbb3-type cytochrome oxidase assembly protein CcoS n=1 Tax=Neisseria sp. TaxID=192066 RepID=UPI0035A0EF23